MTSLLLDPRQLDSDAPLPNNISLNRASASVNFLCVDHDSSANGPAVFLYNYDPKTYNTWYPPFHFRPWSTPAPATTFRDLQRTLTDERPAETRPSAHLPAAIRHVEDMFAVNHLRIEPTPLRQEVWLKFSKSQQQWTLYEFAYFKAIDVDRESLSGAASRLSTTWLPLVGPQFDEATRSEMFDGVPIVDNLVRLLRDAVFVAEIMQAA